MFAKLFHKDPPSKDNKPLEAMMSKELNPRIALHYGILSTASILAFDPIQRLLAIGTMDGRIKVIGGNNIEGLLISPKPLSFKHLQFLQNQGFLISVLKDNEIQVWDMEHRKIASTLKWELNITAFTVIDGTSFMYIGDEYAMVSVLKYDVETGKLLHLPYHVPGSFVADATGVELPYRLSVAGILPQPCSQGNRLLIAYANGLIVLWDASGNQVVQVRGHKDQMLKDIGVVDIPNDRKNKSFNDTSIHEQVEKEITCLCWASTDGSILAVGYVDGDILFWNLSTSASTKDQQAEKSSCDAVKLRLSSDDRRLPIITLHQSVNRSHNNRGCQLFVYGGEEIGSEQVPTVLNLDWSSGIEALKCTGCVDLTLNGAFVDMVLLPAANMLVNDTFFLVLKNSGQLHFYDDPCLSASLTQQERKPIASTFQYHSVVPTVEPYLTVGKLCLVCTDEKFSTALSKIVSAAKLQETHTLTTGNTKWPLTGGVPSELSSSVECQISRLYIAGYVDGSIRIWDATYPTLTLIQVIGSEVNCDNISGSSASVSAVDLCSFTLRVAIGNECGLVCLYELIRISNEKNLLFVTRTDNEVKTVHQGDGPRCRAVFSLLNSPISTLQFANSGDKLAVGFECGMVALLDVSSLAVLFLTECVSGSNSPLTSLAVKSLSDTNCLLSSRKDCESKSSNDPEMWVMSVLTKDGHIFIIEGGMGKMISSNSVQHKESNAISIHIIEGNNSLPEVSSEEHSPKPSQNNDAKDNNAQIHSCSSNKAIELDASAETAYFEERSTGFLVLLCFEDELRLYSLNSVIQGDCKSIKEVKLVKPCCWVTTFKKDENERWLAVLYQSGVIEIRSFPDLEVVGESSLMSILRWDFRTNMEKTMCSSDRGQIVLVNGQELAFISLLTNENDFRIPQSLPSLHDAVLAAADDTLCSSPKENKIQIGGPGILGGIFKGFMGGKVEQNLNIIQDYKKNIKHLESIFSKPPSLEPESTAITDDKKVLNLNIDDINIDDWIPGSSSSSSLHKNKNEKKDKATERKQLFEGATTDMKPQLRTPEDIKAKYRNTGDAAAAAALAKEKLLERKEKLEATASMSICKRARDQKERQHKPSLGLGLHRKQKLTEHSEELENGAQDFASMAKELAKKMENRKWWQL